MGVLAGPPEQSPGDEPFGLQRRVFRGAASNWVGQIVVLGTGFLLTPFVLHRIGVTTFGLWVLAMSLTSYGSLLNLGITSAVVKHVAEHRARGAMDAASRVVSTATLLYVFFAVVALGMAGVVAPFVPDLFNVDPEQRGLAVWLTVLVGLHVAIMLPTSVPGAVLRGLHRFDLVNAVLIAATLVSAAATVAALLLGGGILSLIVISIATTLVMQIPMLWLVRREAPSLRFHPALDWAEIRGVLSFSTSVFGVRVATVINTRTDALVIGAALPVGMVTPYALAQRLSEVVSLLTNQFMQVILPVASELDARRDYRAIRALYLDATRISLAIAFPLAATLLILAPAILAAWVGSQYARYGNLVSLLALAALIDIVAWTGALVLTGMAKHRPLAVMAIVASFLNIALSIALVRPLGLAGVAVGTLVASTVQTCLLVLPYTMRVIGVRMTEFLPNVIGRNLLPGAIVVGVLLAARQTLDERSLGTLGATMLLAIAAYVVAYVRLGASPQERAFYRNLGSSLRRRAIALVGRGDA